MEKIHPVKELGADVVFVGSDWKGTDAWNQYEKEFAEVGCTVVYLDHTDGISSSILREKITKKDCHTERENLSQLPYKEEYSVKVQECLYSVSSPPT